ncbi:MAG: Fur family transcriptional regulator [Gammaproteobacteria bacterium]
MNTPFAMPPVARDDVPAVLQRAKITATPQRIEIAAVLLERLQHLSADQVLERLHRAGSAVSKATVYNTLGLFAERGLVREVMVDNTRLFYDSNTAPHCHFYNVDDGLLTDIPAGEAVVEALPELPEGTSVERIDVVVRVKNDA